MTIRISGIFLILFVFTEPATAQIKEHLNFNKITHRNGLSQSTGQAIIQDHEGYMWFGTHDGLNKYDGYNMTVYKHDPDDPKSISYNEINTFYEDSDNNLWIGTKGKGISIYNRDPDNFTSFPVDDDNPAAGPTENTVSAIVEDKNGRLWIGTDDGLNLFDRETEKFRHFYAEPGNPESLVDNSITDLIIDDDENLWIATRNGLAQLDTDTYTFKQYKRKVNDPYSLNTNFLLVLLQDDSGRIWVGTKDGGLNYFNPEEERFYHYTHDENDTTSLNDNSIQALWEDSGGGIWLGTENRGLSYFEKATEIFYSYTHNPSNPTSISRNSIYSLYESNNHILWIGTFTGDINYIDLKQNNFEHYYHNPYRPNSLSNNSVLSFHEDPSGRFWVGTDGGGLNHFDRKSKTFKAYEHDLSDPNSLNSNAILSITDDDQGNLWLGTYGGGINIFDVQNESFQNLMHDPDDPNSLNINDVYQLHFNEQKLWIGTHGGGINSMDLQTGEFDHYERENDKPGSLMNNFIQDIYQDSHNDLWFGTHGSGLVLFDREGESFTHFTEYNGTFSSITALSIHEDQKGQFWIGTNSGLVLFNRLNHNFTTYTTQDGLNNNTIYGILEDDDGHLWLSTNDGISQFNTDTETFYNYGVDNGLQGHEFNLRSYYKDRDGYMYFGGVNGFNRFHPDSVTISDYTAPVAITNFLIYNEPVVIGEEGSPLERHISQTKEIELPHSSSVITFEYVALNFEVNKKDQFAYMLEGFDKDWNYTSERRAATYTNLNSGNYTFKVKAANSDGIWGTNEASLSLIIIPPFWQTGWFYVLAICLITGIITYSYRTHVRSIFEHNKRLEKEVSLRTSELNEKNQDLKKILTDLQNTRDELVEKAHKAGMADLAANVLHNVGNILNSVNISSSLINEIVDQSHLKNLKKANVLLRENLADIDNFILKDSRGKKLLEYYLKLEGPLDQEYEQLEVQNQRLSEKIGLIIDVVSAQQNYSNTGRIWESISLQQVVENSLIIQAGSYERHDIKIVKNFDVVDYVKVEKTKLIHVLINLMKNAKESIILQQPDEKRINIKLWQNDKKVYLSISDTGTGIEDQLLSKIFNHGYTTKKQGNGYGLHSCANYMQEMGGEIRATSHGSGKGATFTLSFSKLNNLEKGNEKKLT